MFNNLRVIFDQWPKLHLALDALSNQKILNSIYYQATNPVEQKHQPKMLTFFCFEEMITFLELKVCGSSNIHYLRPNKMAGNISQ